ncbi:MULTISPECIES: hypothetical protein [Citrobacter]|nr:MULTISPECIES: hypothetical protein [Citrobacter]EKY5003093.1 hypothetical protein [Citrobacter amalonaticus]ELB4228771.1 hypothetical protein [Citrobacter amalonaticus]ELN9501475.1 hypothetical protein [Citrobacter amalonaticus]ELW9349124.1 hypothetical protein [Citrobacter amalonaticus]KDF11673.1 hypothetical protein AF41_00845 [Citrobacter sp. MGH 55]
MKKLFMRLMCFFLIIFPLAILDLQIFGFVMTDFLSLIRMGDVITYHHTCLLISGIPLMLYTTFAMVRVLFSNDLQYKALPDPFEVWALARSFLLSALLQTLLSCFYFWYRHTTTARRTTFMIIM